jgi:hypothetical protein
MVRLGQGKVELSSVYFISIFISTTITISVLVNIGCAKENAYRQAHQTTMHKQSLGINLFFRLQLLLPSLFLTLKQDMRKWKHT